MKRLAACLLLALASPSTADAAVRAVFVGIDTYENSRKPGRDTGFDNLLGAVADVNRIKQALARSHGLPLDTPAAGGCRSANALSTTLTNECATKANILAAWNEAIAAASPGDTLILYFAGHGSRFIDSDVGDQVSRHNSTLMAHDARRDNAPSGDIIDHEVRAVIDAATARGIRMVTWFDSCNSGTASRDGQSVSRTAPDLRVPGLQPVVAPRQYGNLGAYRVHIGAAGDGEDALEVGGVGKRAGVFTTALAAALEATPNASFADLAARVVTDVAARTQGKQVPHAEGALRATLGGPEIRLPLFEAAQDSGLPGRLRLAGGSLVGVTTGSRFQIFPSTTDALKASDGAPLLTARVTELTPGQAVLTPETPLPPGLQGRLVAREIAHDFGGQVLALAVGDAAALPAVRKLGFVRVDDAAPFALLPAADGMRLRGPDGGELATLPPPGASDFGLRLASALEKIARVERWFTIVQERPGVSLCVEPVMPDTDFDPAWCRTPADGEPVLKRLQPANFGVVNEATGRRHVYVLAIGRRYSVTLVLPAFGAIEPDLDPGQAIVRPPGQRLRPSEAGALRFVVLSSDQPLNAAALEQSGTDVADLEACSSPVARVFCLGSNRARAGGWQPLREWSAAMVTARVEP